MDNEKTYSLLCAASSKLLTDRVNAALKSGYTIYGNHTVTALDPENMIAEYCVSVTK